MEPFATARRTGLLVAGALAALAVGTGGASAQSATWPGCDSYSAQAQAQAAWESMGRPARADGDDDGRVCESLPASEQAPQDTGGCKRQRRAVRVKLDRSKYPLTADHVADATRSRLRGGEGKPKVLHIDRAGTDANRAAATHHLPTKPGHDRDEYPMAMSREGGHGASVRHVPSSDNRGAGASVGGQLRGWCEGQAFRIVIVP